MGTTLSRIIQAVEVALLISALPVLAIMQCHKPVLFF